MGQAPVEQIINRGTELITNKRSRSVIFVIISFIFILAINSLLPVIEGEAHYTADAVKMSYQEYRTRAAEDKHIRLTWSSEQSVDRFVKDYINTNPDLTTEEKMPMTILATHGAALEVHVYTKFFFQSTFWYISTLIAMVSSTVMFYSLFNYLLTIAKERRKTYVDLLEELATMRDNHLDPITFEPWMIDVFNYERKIKQHKANVKYEIDKLERKVDHRVRKNLQPFFTAYGTENEFPLASMENLTKKELKYANKKLKLLSLLDDDYIKEYVVDGKVKYFKYIHPMFVYNGQNLIGRSVDTYSNIQSDSHRIGKDAAVRIMSIVMMTLIFTTALTVTVISATNQSPFWIVVNVITRIAPLLLQIPLAMNYSNNFMDTQLITNLINRRSIGYLYLASNKHTPEIGKDVYIDGKTY